MPEKDAANMFEAVGWKPILATETHPLMLFAPPSNEPAAASPCRIPASLRSQLRSFRRRVWTIKMIEAVGLPVVTLTAALVTVAVLDRRWETPASVRAALLLITLVAGLAIPLALYRWVWRHRQPQQLARLLGRKLPQTGDALLGVIELARSAAEQQRSPVLCQAAIDQVASQSQMTDLRIGLPPSRHRASIAASTLAVVMLGGAWAAFPLAAGNVWSRLVMPWIPVPRYTFTRIASLPDPLVVPHGEAWDLSVDLRRHSRWQPQHATLQLGKQRTLVARRSRNGYRFTLPPQIDPSVMRLRVGDATERIEVRPTLRPELVSVLAAVDVPDYLGRPATTYDVRGGSLTVVKGSHLRLSIAAGRPLAAARVNGRSYTAVDGAVTTQPLRINDTESVSIRWRDVLGLDQREKFVLQIRAVDDLAPTVTCEGLPQKSVVLDTELLTFRVQAADDYGVRRVGMQWQPDSAAETLVAAGEQPLAAGGPMVPQLTAAGAFRADHLGVPPQPIELRVWVEDYLPGRPRVYSPPVTLHVVNSEEHASWLADQLTRWYGQALEVRDRELQLHETNRQLRGLTVAQRNDAAARQRLEQQAADERENGRRLADVTRSGQQLLRTAARNPEMDAEHLQRWAATLQTLTDIADNRMPSVADLLNAAATDPLVDAPSRDAARSVAGQNRLAAPPANDDENADPVDARKGLPKTPKLVDVESTLSSPPSGAAASSPSPGGPTRLGLAATTVLGDSAQEAAAPAVEPAVPTSLDQAVEQQQQLLEEFELVADQLSELLANLEGSTLVKRLKAASRSQMRIATAIAAQLQGTFAAASLDSDRGDVLTQLATEQVAGLRTVSLVMDDMQAYVQRRPQAQVHAVLADMRHADVLGGLRELAETIPQQQGLALSDSEYWSDALDHWAQALVAPAASGQAPGAAPSSSLPPAVVLQVLQVLQSEVDLRDATRVAQQARDAQAIENYQRQAVQLAQNQHDVRQRLERVVADIARLPDGEARYADDLRLLKSVLPVMRDAGEILATPETGPPAVAAETEAIELLLKSNQVNPGTGGGGGTAGSGGGGGAEPTSPLALVGAGINQQEQRQSPDAPQSIGVSGISLPEEFRRGLDEYFNRLEP